MKKTKRLLALATALVLTLSLTACGEKVDTSAMTSAFNATSAVYDETAKLMNDNMDKLDQQTIDDYKAISENMLELKSQIENESITQEEADAITEILKPMPDQLKEMKAAIETIIAAASAPAASDLPEGITQDQLDELAAVVAEIDPLYTEAADLAEQNGWFADDTTDQELTAIASLLDATDAGIADPALFIDADIATYITNIKKLIPLVPPIIERVSVPFEAPEY
ncbi:MAG: hypothetical protein RR211_06245 [Pseudoflavonifractor sp.]